LRTIKKGIGTKTPQTARLPLVRDEVFGRFSDRKDTERGNPETNNLAAT
jgi:hypothetical protein